MIDRIEFNACIMQRVCRHESNHAVEAVWRGLGINSLTLVVKSICMFCDCTFVLFYL